MSSDEGRGRRVPDWLIGLVIAVVIVILGALVLSYLGAGDDPTFNQSESAPAAAPAEPKVFWYAKRFIFEPLPR